MVSSRTLSYDHLWPPQSLCNFPSTSTFPLLTPLRIPFLIFPCRLPPQCPLKNSYRKLTWRIPALMIPCRISPFWSVVEFPLMCCKKYLSHDPLCTVDFPLKVTFRIYFMGSPLHVLLHDPWPMFPPLSRLLTWCLRQFWERMDPA